MKELLNRIITFTLSTACLAMVSPINTVATDIATVECTPEVQEEVIVDIDLEDVNHDIVDTGQITMPSFGSNPSADTFNYYYNLSSNNMAVYNTLTCMVDPQVEPISISLPEPVRVNLGQRGSADALTAEETSYVSTILEPEFLPGYGYLLLDYPEIWWQDTGFSYGYDVAFEYNELTDEYTLVINSVNMYFALHPHFNGDYDMARQYKNDLTVAIDQFQVEGSTRYEKLKSMHDQLAEMITYDLNAEMPFTAPAAMLLKSSVCEGYAESLKLLCDREGIPCIVVVSSNHMWNQVQMEDGNWYYIDATWDDYDGLFNDIEYGYDNFLKGSITAFKTGHFTVTSLYGVKFSAPALSRADYVVPEIPVVETTVPETTTTVAPVTEQAPVTTTIQYKCDVNADNILSVSDVVICQATILTFTGAPSDASCDVNNDGTVNVFDLIMMKRMLRRSEYTNAS